MAKKEKKGEPASVGCLGTFLVILFFIFFILCIIALIIDLMIIHGSLLIKISGIALILIIIIAIKQWLHLNINKRYTIEQLSVMDGHKFEYACADILKSNGFKNVKVTPGSGDYGVDILAEKHGTRYAVQCKRYSQKLDNTAIQEVVGGLAYYHCQKGIVMTTNYFTKPAIKLAIANNVELWDKDKINHLLLATANKKQNTKHSCFNPKPDEKAKELFASKLKELSYIIIETMNSNSIGCSVKDIFTDSKGVLYELYCSDTITESVISSIADAILSPNAHLCESAVPDIKKIFFEYPESLKILYDNYMRIM